MQNNEHAIGFAIGVLLGMIYLMNPTEQQKKVIKKAIEKLENIKF